MRGWGNRVPNLGHVGPNGPLSSQSPLYFPNLADGGPAAGQCQTLFSFVNPNNSPISALLVWNADKGSPLSLDFGTGAHSQFRSASLRTAQCVRKQDWLTRDGYGLGCRDVDPSGPGHRCVAPYRKQKTYY